MEHMAQRMDDRIEGGLSENERLGNDLADAERSINDLKVLLGQREACIADLEAQIGTAPEGSHPDEQKPRAETWHQERLNWRAEVERLCALNAALEAKLEAIVKPSAEFIRDLC